jgi:hypothetical protein
MSDDEDNDVEDVFVFETDVVVADGVEKHIFDVIIFIVRHQPGGCRRNRRRRWRWDSSCRCGAATMGCWDGSLSAGFSLFIFDSRRRFKRTKAIAAAA